jgi:hypothetical protein
LTDPLPVPLVLPVRWIQVVEFVVFQEQPFCVETVTAPLAVPEPSETEPGDVLKLQGAPSCVIATTRPATAIEPLRGEVLVFACT